MRLIEHHSQRTNPKPLHQRQAGDQIKLEVNGMRQGCDEAPLTLTPLFIYWCRTYNTTVCLTKAYSFLVNSTVLHWHQRLLVPQGCHEEHQDMAFQSLVVKMWCSARRNIAETE